MRHRQGACKLAAPAPFANCLHIKACPMGRARRASWRRREPINFRPNSRCWRGRPAEWPLKPPPPGRSRFGRRPCGAFYASRPRLEAGVTSARPASGHLEGGATSSWRRARALPGGGGPLRLAGRAARGRLLIFNVYRGHSEANPLSRRPAAAVHPSWRPAGRPARARLEGASARGPIQAPFFSKGLE